MPRPSRTDQFATSPSRRAPVTSSTTPATTPSTTPSTTPPATPAAQPRTRRRFPYGKLVLLVLIAWVAYLVAVPVIAWKRIDQVNATPAGARPADQPGTTYL